MSNQSRFDETDSDVPSNDGPIADLVYQIIFDAISARKLPGSLTEKDLVDFVNKQLAESGASRLVSRNPVKRAIGKLENSKILAVIPKVGTNIRIPRDAELAEIWDERVTVEDHILTSLARRRERNLKPALGIHRQMKTMLDHDSPILDFDNHQRFVLLDESLHHELAIAAGYPGLAEELDLLRLKLRLAAPLNKFDDLGRYYSIYNEHNDILSALAGSPVQEDGSIAEISSRPDINRVRLAFLVHMRNSSKYSWNIESLVRARFPYGQNIAFDVPDLDILLGKQDPVDISFECWLEMRISTELCAVATLAARPNAEISVPLRLHDELKSVYQTALKFNGFTPVLVSRFYNADLSFHGALCYAAGMLFGEQVVNFAWHQANVFCESRELTIELAERIVEEHSRVLNSIRRTDGSEEDIKLAAKHMEDHIFESFARRKFEASMLEKASERLKERYSRYRIIIDK